MQRILYALIIIIATGACTLQEQDNPLLVGTCRDGIKNQDEEAVDCGGVCLACQVDVPIGKDAWSPCHESFTNNNLKIDGTSLSITPGTLVVETPTLTGNYYEYTIAIQKGSLRIRLAKGSKPNRSRIYNLTRQPIVDSLRTGFAHILYKPDDSEYKTEAYHSGDGDRLYMTVTGSTLTFELCDAKLHRLSEYSNEIQKSIKIEGQIVYKAPPAKIYGCNSVVSTNQFMYRGSKVTFTQADVKYSAPSQNADFYEFKIKDPSSSYYSKELTIRISADRVLTADRVYNIAESSSPRTGDAYVGYYDGGSTFSGGKNNDKLYMTITKDNQIKMEFCDVDVFNYGYTYGTVYGLIIFQR